MPHVEGVERNKIIIVGGVKGSVHIHEENEATATVCTHSGFLTI